MSIINVIEGIVLIVFGAFLLFSQVRSLKKEDSDRLAGSIGLLIIGVGCVVCGIVLIGQHID
jgi:hypothetical protein